MISTLIISGILILALELKLARSAKLRTLYNSVGSLMESMADEMAALVTNQTHGFGWMGLVAGIFAFIFASNWAGALLPMQLIRLPIAELKAPTSDINITTALALIWSHAYFYAGLSAWKLRYFGRYVMPVAFLLPINLLEDFSKPLSLSFRLLGNILADELTIAVLGTLVPILIPIPVMLLGIFTSAIQALVFATLASAYIGESIELFA